ncbi:hypothetical protein AAFF_G00066030 [Aldrovandia affinis]|uniref:Uncharacterized protein n=1 Tax=Aldrovandia affinis TaxID=143900 RepID=A0AAD7T402_9TELE|nr:hypothetical protein AAFF_G00066030 [Aldrovandia affinis]
MKSSPAVSRERHRHSLPASQGGSRHTFHPRPPAPHRHRAVAGHATFPTRHCRDVTPAQCCPAGDRGSCRAAPIFSQISVALGEVNAAGIGQCCCGTSHRDPAGPRPSECLLQPVLGCPTMTDSLPASSFLPALEIGRRRESGLGAARHRRSKNNPA